MELASKVAGLLESTFKAKSSEEIRSAEAELGSLSQNKETFLQSLLYIIASSQLLVSEKVKVSACVYLKNFILRELNENNFNGNLRDHLTKAIFACMTAERSSIELQSSLGSTLGPLFMQDFFDAQPVLLESLIPSILSCLNGQKNEVIGSLITIRSIFGVFSDNINLLQIFKHISEAILSVPPKEIIKIQKAFLENDVNDLLESSNMLYE